MGVVSQNLKLLLIRIADWFDEQILGHNYPGVCNKIAGSNWWNSPPMELNASIKYDIESDTLNIRLSKRKKEMSEYVKPGIIIDYDFDRNIVALEILDMSDYIDEARRAERERLIADLKESIHEALTGNTIPASKLLESLEDMD